MNFHDDNWIFERLNKHYEIAKTRHPEDSILGVILRGSQNYGLDSENSDIDTICIIVPTFNEMAQNKELTTYEYIDPETENRILFKDVRLYVDCLRKQGISFIETLFTKYYIVNKKYETNWYTLRANKDSISSYNPDRAINAAYGVFNKYYKECEKILKTEPCVPGKTLSRLPQMLHFLENYTCNADYLRCITPNPSVKLFKENEAIDTHEAFTWMKSWREMSYYYYSNFEKLHCEVSKEVSNNANCALETFCYSTIQKNCAKDFTFFNYVNEQ